MTRVPQLQETTGIEAIDLDHQREEIGIEHMPELPVVVRARRIVETEGETIQEIRDEMIEETGTEMMDASAMMTETQKTVEMTVKKAEMMIEYTTEAGKKMRQRQEAGVRAARNHRRGMRR